MFYRKAELTDLKLARVYVNSILYIIIQQSILKQLTFLLAQDNAGLSVISIEVPIKTNYVLFFL